MSTTILGRSQVGAVATSCGVGGLDCTVDRRIASTMIMNFMGKGGAPAVYLTTAATVSVGGALLARLYTLTSGPHFLS